MTIKVGIAGASGRMGAAVQVALRDAAGLTAAIALVRSGGEKPEGIASAETLEAFLAECDVVVDFSCPGLLAELAQACAATGRPLVSGTTGLDGATHGALAEAATRVPVMHSPNMSIGVNILLHLVEKASETLGSGWTCEVFDAHHEHKVDAPSGTALRLGSAVESRRGGSSVRYEVERAGATIGFHEVRFDGPGERILLGHEALDRDIFALGALRAVRWLVDKPPGLYGMDDVLGLKSV